MYWIICAIVLVLFLYIIAGHNLSKKVRKIQDICSENYWGFDMYVNTSTDFEFSDKNAPDSLKIMYKTPFGLQSKYLSYHGTKKLEEALDELIKHFEE